MNRPEGKRDDEDAYLFLYHLPLQKLRNLNLCLVLSYQKTEAYANIEYCLSYNLRCAVLYQNISSTLNSLHDVHIVATSLQCEWTSFLPEAYEPQEMRRPSWVESVLELKVSAFAVGICTPAECDMHRVTDG